MHQSRILYLIISLCIAVSLTSCATQTITGFAKAKVEKDRFSTDYFSDTATDYVYKAGIAVYGREFGGILIIKKVNDSTHRVALTTDFGNKLLDFEISDAGFKVNYILEELDRKVIVNTLQQDFMLLLKQHHEVTEQYFDETFTVYKSEQGRRFNYLFTDKDSGELIKMVHATKAKEKVIFTYVPKSNTLAQKIGIEHKNINLTISLNYIN